MLAGSVLKVGTKLISDFSLTETPLAGNIFYILKFKSIEHIDIFTRHNILPAGKIGALQLFIEKLTTTPGGKYVLAMPTWKELHYERLERRTFSQLKIRNKPHKEKNYADMCDMKT
uniref:Uncharacterized protein n=1 Tax=Glossina austeni TaxID=7395 RepID=A0A1A9V1A6_GLOAU